MQDEIRSCPECLQHRTTLSFMTVRFKDELKKMFAIPVPVWRCDACGYSYTEGSAENLEHDAVCRSRGLLTSREIRNLRERLGLTRKRLGELTGFGEASIKRWETGSLIQNVSSDRLLRLLECPGVIYILSTI